MKKEMSLAIPFKKFFLYNFLTFGVYSTIWSYRIFRYFDQNEKEFSEKQTGKSGSLIKAMFLIFFIQDLFKMSVLANKEQTPKHDIKSINKSAIFVVLMILGNYFLNISETINPFFLENASRLTILLIILLGVFFTLGMFYFFKKPIENFQLYFSEIEKGKEIKERQLHWWEVLLSIRGVITWGIILLGIIAIIFNSVSI
jgi:hypothetical protein